MLATAAEISSTVQEYGSVRHTHSEDVQDNVVGEILKKNSR